MVVRVSGSEDTDEDGLLSGDDGEWVDETAAPAGEGVQSWTPPASSILRQRPGHYFWQAYLTGAPADDAEEPSADEQFSALLEGLRATLPGVEVLFGFLLVLPFQQNFKKLQGSETRIYVVALVFAAMALVLRIAPSVHQRVRAPFTGLPRRNVRHVRFGAYLGIAGSVSAPDLWASRPRRR